jgi:PAS domain S-box-containing protein
VATCRRERLRCRCFSPPEVSLPSRSAHAADAPFLALPSPAFTVGVAGAVTSWNAAAERAYGFRAREATGGLPPVFSGPDRERYLAALARLLADQWDGELAVHCGLRGGGTQPTTFRLAPLRQRDQTCGAVFLALPPPRARARDDRVRPLQAVIDAIPAPIWFKDAAGVYLGCNAEFERYLGLSRAQIVGRSVFDIAPHDLAEVYRKADLALLSRRATQRYENEVQWADGTRRTVVFCKATTVDAAGEITGLAGTMLDVSDLRAAERELRARLAQQASLTRLAARALGEGDPRELLGAAARLAVEAHGADGGGVVELSGSGGRRLVRFAGWVGPQPAVAELPLADDPIASRVVATGRPLVVNDADAEPEAVPGRLRAAGVRSLAAVLVGSRDAPAGVLAVFRNARRAFSDEDVRSLEANAHVLAIALDRGRAREAARAAQERLVRAERLASIGTLAAGVAHELNNPLTFVLSNLEFVADVLRERTAGVDAGDACELLRAVDDASEGAERMRAIVRDLRTLGRADDATEEPVEVRRVVEYAVHLASSEIRRRARLTWELGAVPPVRGNEGRLGQVLLNLLVNAAHAIPEGATERNEIRVATRVMPDGRVALEVRDTGAGIAPELHGRIFDPFFTTKPVGLGTGLGLWVCQNIVAAAGGAIEVESAPGRGTTFRVLLPAAGPARAATEDDPRPRVLVVDDEPLVAAAVRRHLAGRFAVDAASGREDALARLAGPRRYEAVVCDVAMPDGGGFALLDALREHAPELAGRVLFVTGGVPPEASELLARTNLPRLEKPFDGEQLRDALREVLASAAPRAGAGPLARRIG